MLLFFPPGAHAASQRTDPTADSPAGAIYQIPLDTGRRDAAPLPGGRGGSSGHGSGGAGAGAAVGGGFGGSGGSGGAGGTGGTGTVRSASGGSGSGGAGGSGGSGAPDGTGGTGGSHVAAKLPGGAPANNPSSIHSENGYGSSSKIPGLDAAAPVAAEGGSGGGSMVPAFALLILVGGLAAWVGTSAARSVHRL